MATAAQIPETQRAEAAGLGWQDVQDLTCSLVAEIPVRGLRIRDLFLLEAGTIIDSKETARGMVKLQADGSFIGWAEFEAVNGRLGVRLTELD